MSILSKEKDGAGYWYGFHESDPRQINVSGGNSKSGEYYAFVGSEAVENLEVGRSTFVFGSKQSAEAAAIAFLKTGRRT